MKINSIPYCGVVKSGRVSASPKFGSMLAMDCGGSTPQSSKKKVVWDDNGEIIYREEGVLNDETKLYYEDGHDFKNRVIENFLGDASYANEQSLLKTNKPDKVKGIAFFVPSYTMKNAKVLYMPNMKDKTGKPLQNIDFSDMQTILESRGIKFSKNPNIKILQDANGSGLAIGKKLYEEGLLTPGKKYIVALTGGGCGICKVECNEEGTAIIRSSGSAIISTPGDLKKISAEGASARSFTRNFCLKLGIDNKLTENIVNCGKAIFTSETSFSPSKNDFRDQQLAKYLVESKLYEEVEDMSGNSYIKMIEEAKPRYNKAWDYALNKYAKALSVLETNGIMTGYNGLIVTGPFANALQRRTEELSDRIEEFANESILGNDEAKVYKDALDFKVYVGGQYLVKDNTPGAEVALSQYTKFIDPNNTGAGLKVDYAKLCQETKKVLKKIK